MSQQELADSATARAGVQPAAACVEAVKGASIVAANYQTWTAENLEGNLKKVKYFLDHDDHMRAVIVALLDVKAKADSQILKVLVVSPKHQPQQSKRWPPNRRPQYPF